MRRDGSLPRPADTLVAPAPRSPDADGDGMRLRAPVEHLIALGYAWAYDAIVEGFGPYERLLDEVVALIRRCPGAGDPAATRVLDVACGTGTVARRLAREGYAVVGLDVVKHLVAVARERSRARGGGAVTFHQADVAADPVPGAGTFDVLVSMHTLYWHPRPVELLAGCRRALRPGGHGIILTYARPARVGSTFRRLWAREGPRAALRALRWLLPTALFEALRAHRPRYLSREEFRAALGEAGFEVLEARETFLAGISHLAWVRNPGPVGPEA